VCVRVLYIWVELVVWGLCITRKWTAYVNKAINVKMSNKTVNVNLELMKNK